MINEKANDGNFMYWAVL